LIKGKAVSRQDAKTQSKTGNSLNNTQSPNEPEKSSLAPRRKERKVKSKRCVATCIHPIGDVRIVLYLFVLLGGFASLRDQVRFLG
jgi:hypothetical protein